MSVFFAIWMKVFLTDQIPSRPWIWCGLHCDGPTGRRPSGPTCSRWWCFVAFAKSSLSARNCQSGRPLDPCGHHRAACAETGMFGRRKHALESMHASDTDPTPNTWDGRRLEVVVDGLPVQGGAQVAIDTTMVCAWRAE